MSKKQKHFLVPWWFNRAYITFKILKSLKNSDTVTLKEVICPNGSYKLPKDDKLRMELCRKPTDADKTTFVRYYRLDGKPEESRIDKLFKVKYAKRFSSITGCLLHSKGNLFLFLAFHLPIKSIEIRG